MRKTKRKHLKAKWSHWLKGWQAMCCMHWVAVPQLCWAGLPGLARCYLIFLFTEGKGNTSHTVFLISASSALSCHAAGTMIPEESFCPFSLSSSFLWLGSRSSWAVKVFWGAYLEPLHWIPYGLKHAWIVWFDLHGPRNWDTGTFAQGVFLAGD